MNRIRLLSEQVANQIAAGEVIERPASVVKELVENALDAQATHITVDIQAGGRSLIRVADDGLGMSRDDALLCLERHATSKIRRAEDLAAVTSMGFRGEAIPSIASVSRFTLTTRERDNASPEGTRVQINGGKMLDVQAAGSATGTTIEVRQLFFNLPARRKFLRSEETESAHIIHYLTVVALAFPEVAFSFVKDGRSVWQLPAVKSGIDPAARLAGVRERLRALYGTEQKLLAVDFSAELAAFSESPGPFTGEPASQAMQSVPPGAAAPGSFRVWGFIGAPGVSRATREDQHLFVNRRPIENRGLNFALLEGYHTALMKGRYPVCCLFLEIDPAAVDVNIHPAKREVKFHRETEVRRLVTQAVRQSLVAFHAPAREMAATRPESAEGGVSRPAPPTSAAPTSDAALPPPRKSLQLSAAEPPASTAIQPALPMGFSPKTPQPVVLATPAQTPPPSMPAAAVAAGSGVQSSLVAVPSGPPPLPPAAVPLLEVPLRLVGVIGRLYVVFESDRGLVLLDQHAAHERILFEQMLGRLERQEQAPSQKLLLPATLEFSARDAAFLRKQLPVLVRLGVGVSEFGERTFLLDALPPFVKTCEPRQFVLELVDELRAAGQEVNTLRLGEHMVAKTVCRHAVKAHDPLAGSELEGLLAELRRCTMPYTCPHGRPTLIEMNFRELEKKFGRSQ